MSVLLSATMMFSCVPTTAFAAEASNAGLSEQRTEHTDYSVSENSTVSTGNLGTTENAESTPTDTVYTVESPVSASDVGLPGNDELFAMYAEQKLYGYEMATFGTKARDNLSNDVEKAIYDALKSNIESVAISGGSTSFVLSDISGLKTQWTILNWVLVV